MGGRQWGWVGGVRLAWEGGWQCLLVGDYITMMIRSPGVCSVLVRLSPAKPAAADLLLTIGVCDIASTSIYTGACKKASKTTTTTNTTTTTTTTATATAATATTTKTTTAATAAATATTTITITTTSTTTSPSPPPPKHQTRSHRYPYAGSSLYPHLNLLLISCERFVILAHESQH